MLTPVNGDLRGKGIAIDEDDTRSEEETRDSEPRGQRTLEQGESSGSANSEPRQPRYRSLEDIYNEGEVHLVCLLADSEDITFSEAVKDEKWLKAMDEEIGAIEKNQTWEVADLSEGHKP